MLFPAGILREPLTALKRADAVLLTRSDRSENVLQLKESVGAFTGAPVFTARYSPRDLVNVSTGEIRPLAFLAGKPVFAFAGIARPDSFVSLLETPGSYRDRNSCL